MRYVRDVLVLRLQHTIPDWKLAALNEEFAGILASGKSVMSTDDSVVSRVN